MNEDHAQEQITSPVDLSGASIRAQLLWASLFPLAFFGLLSTLVTSSALNQMMLNLVTQRNAAQVQVLADSLTVDFSAELMPASSVLNSVLQTLEPVEGSRLYLIDVHGRLLASSEPGLGKLPLQVDELALLIQDYKAASQLMESTTTLDKVVVSFAPLPGENLGVILEEPLAASMLPTLYYQLVLVGLLALGTALSLGMLSLGIGRVIRPIAVLARNATGAVPGSIFRPVPERGPSEIQALTRAFNQMVIRLAEQQTILRQYAHKALLSQEKERQRLSHELHDGTLQDLVGLTQRVELCRNELDCDPLLARRRLDELHGLLEQTLGDVRRISNALRPSILEDLGLSTALQALCNDIEQQMPSLHCFFTITGLEHRLMPDLELAIFRVVQEALSNIRKHAGQATRVDVELMFHIDEVATLVHNDGPPFSIPDVRNLVRSGHIGLAGMYERARLFHGELTITSDPAAGTKVSLRLPCLVESVGTETGASMKG